MTIRKLAPFVREELKGKNLAAAGTCVLPLLGEALFRSAEAAVFSVWLYLDGKKPAELFRANDRLLLGAALIRLHDVDIADPVGFLRRHAVVDAEAGDQRRRND